MIVSSSSSSSSSSCSSSSSSSSHISYRFDPDGRKASGAQNELKLTIWSVSIISIFEFSI